MRALDRHARYCLPNRLLARVALTTAAIGMSIAAYQAVADARDRRRFPAPGRLMDIGGRRIHLMDAGEGKPAVVIIPALGEGVLGWVPIWREFAKVTRSCVYDRAGIGWSDSPGSGWRTYSDMADELHSTLTAAGIPPPYLLVGHSMGGIIARRFAVQYLGEVAGMVLVDSSHEDQARRLGLYIRMHHLRRLARRIIRPASLRRLVADVDPQRRLDAELAVEVPPNYIAAARAITLSSRERRTNIREMLLMSRSHGQPPSLGELPLTVLSADEKHPRWDPLWAPMQAELAALSTRSTHITAISGHYMHLDNPGLVTGAIRDLLKAIRMSEQGFPS